MKTKSIDKILKKGSPKQRACLLFDNFAAQGIGGKGFLTENQEKLLGFSFIKEQEKRVFNEFLTMDRKVRSSLAYLSYLSSQYREKIAFLTGYCIMWHTYEVFEETINSIIHEAKDNAELKQYITDLLANNSMLFLAGIEVDEEGFIKIDTANGRWGRKRKQPDIMSLEEITRQVSDMASTYLIQSKTVIKTLRDFMETTGFKVRTYSNALKEAEDEIKANKAFMPRYSKSFTEVQTKQLGLSITEERKFKSGLMEKNFVFPDYGEVEEDEEYGEFFRDEFLEYE